MSSVFESKVENFFSPSTHEGYLGRIGRNDQDAQKLILNFLGWTEPEEGQFANDTRIVLVSAEFSKEITSAVLWLNEKELDIRVSWIKAVPFAEAVSERGFFGNQNTVARPTSNKWNYTIQVLTERFGIT